MPLGAHFENTEIGDADKDNNDTAKGRMVEVGIN